MVHIYVLYRDAAGKTHPHSLHWPESLDHYFSESEQRQALKSLECLEPEIQQQLIDELAARCLSDSIRNPAGYLRGLIRKAEKGEFKVWSSQLADPPEPSPSAAVPLLKASSSDVMQPVVTPETMSEEAKAARAQVMELFRKIRSTRIP